MPNRRVLTGDARATARCGWTLKRAQKPLPKGFSIFKREKRPRELFELLTRVASLPLK